MWGWLKQLREVLWPVLEGEATRYPLKAEEIIASLEGETDKEKLDKLLELSKGIYQDEERRRAVAESKATTLLGATGLTMALIVGFGKSLIFDQVSKGGQRFGLYVFTVAFVITMIYFSRAIHYALKTLGRAAYESMTPKDVIEIKGLSAADYGKTIATAFLAKTITNYAVVNEKVDWFVMSREYFLRAIYTIVLATILLSLASLYDMCSVDVAQYIRKFIH